jgi:intracellular septation protein A
MDFLSVAFDSGGVTTGPMTVPFILALGVGAASIRSDKDAQSDSFGLVGLCSVGPILAVLILGILYKGSQVSYEAEALAEAATTKQVTMLFWSDLPHRIMEVAIALLPIIVFFGLFQIIVLKLKKAQIIRIVIGLVYTYFGLVLFLTGVNVGFMPLGRYLGQTIGSSQYNWIMIPIGMIIGYFIVIAEPAVHVLSKQVVEMTSGAIPKKAISTSLSIGVSASVGLAMLRIITGMPLMYLLIPGYAIALILTFFVPPVFTAIAFDSGGVASGPMTATFLLPLAIGVCLGVGGNVAVDAFGLVAMVAMTPLITIQGLGLFYKFKLKAAEKEQKQKLMKKESIINF